jgi:hypothetical protein
MSGYYRYIENYTDTDGDITCFPGDVDPTFCPTQPATWHTVDWHEFYDLAGADPNRNAYGNDGNPNNEEGATGPAPTPMTTHPHWSYLSQWIARYLKCKGPEMPPRVIPDYVSAPTCP